jgi:hypothetical protein
MYRDYLIYMIHIPYNEAFDWSTCDSAQMKFIIVGNYTDMNAADEYKSSAALSAAECGLISVNNEND